MKKTLYEEGICNRSLFRFLLGLYPRTKTFVRFSIINYIARKNGAQIGRNVRIPLKLARIANQNLRIGNHTNIQTHLIDTRCPVSIGSYVIINPHVQIITKSHNVDSKDYEHKDYGLYVGDYAWIATKALILPSCRRIEKGAVCAAGSVVVKDVKEMAIVTGNPAQELRIRKEIHEDICVESLLGGDLIAYVRSYISKF